MNMTQMAAAARRDAGMVSTIKVAAVERVIFRCKRCGTTEAHEYVGDARVIPGTRTMVMLEKGWPVTRAHDERCPSCRRYRSMATVKGTYNPEHVCNSRCMGAVGPSCDCSCGGANHGGGHLN